MDLHFSYEMYRIPQGSHELPSEVIRMTKNPGYRIGDQIVFKADRRLKGRIFAVSANECNGITEFFYDIFVNRHPDYPAGVIYKHVRERHVLNLSV